MSLKIIGNPTNDTIYFNDSEECVQRQGGICNILRHLEVSCDIHATALSEANIFVGEQRESYVLWNRKILNEDYKPTLWAHISYLDCVDVNINALRSPFVSADLCLLTYTEQEKRNLRAKLRYVDWLIVSQENIDALGGLPRVKEGAIIRGDRNIVVVWNDITRAYPNRWITVKDPVGAGDYFVAKFLSLVHNTGFDHSKEAAVIDRCVDFTIRCLRQQNG